MKASELIKKLQQALKTHGDLFVGLYDTDHNYYDLVTEIEIRTQEEIKHLGHNSEFLGKKFIEIF